MAAAAPFAEYAGQRLCLASQHQKERALSRPFQAALGLTLVIAEELETDAFGSFSGEHARLNGPQTTCLLKAQAGMALTGLDLGLASEGSFGPHPALPLLAVGIECLTFVDGPRSLVIQESRISARTNFRQLQLRPGDDLDGWLQQVGFPSHGLLVRPLQPSALEAAPIVAKGLQTRDALEQAIRSAAALSEDGQVQVDTDMRAHVNPTRMAAIRSLGFQLVRRLRHPCPACGAPGWGLLDRVPGLPCDWCGRPTQRIAQEVFGCSACDHRQVHPRRDGLRVADPGHCESCNP